MGDMRNAHRIFFGKPEGERPLIRPRRRWEDNIRMDLREGVVWMHMSQYSDHWRAVVNTGMNLRVPQKADNFLTSRVTVDFSRRILVHGVSYLVNNSKVQRS